jgi:citrate lyase subunit beta / citryl-CoA lyase
MSPRDLAWRSMLFLPAHVDRFVSRAYTRGADAYILDLEDSVPINQKLEARSKLAAASEQVARGGSDILVRVNGQPGLLDGDIAAAVAIRAAAIVIPKVNSADFILDVEAKVRRIEQRLQVEGTLLIAQIEDVCALPQLDAIAACSARLLAMTLGSEDFALSAGIEPCPEALLMPNQLLSFACRRAGILAFGFPASIANYLQLGELQAAVRLARKLGFAGAFCIHPTQIGILNEGFSPSEAEVAWAKGLLAANARALQVGRGAFEYQGRMIDAPVLERARGLLRRVRN